MAPCNVHARLPIACACIVAYLSILSMSASNSITIMLGLEATVILEVGKCLDNAHISRGQLQLVETVAHAPLLAQRTAISPHRTSI